MGKSPNTSAIGSRVTIKNGEIVQVRQVESSTGASGQNDLVLHFGLGKNSEQLIPIDIVWVNGEQERSQVKINQLNNIIQR